MDARRSEDVGGPSATLALLALPRFPGLPERGACCWGGNHAVEACQIHTRLGHQGRETSNEVEWLARRAEGRTPGVILMYYLYIPVLRVGTPCPRKNILFLKGTYCVVWLY